MRPLPAQRALIDHAAAMLGKSVSDFILEAASERARAVACEQVFLCLDTKRFRQFAARSNARSHALEEASPTFIAKVG
ncbi:MAG: DUF1778 domain-containing protein [Gammaproteobacteria bacterium]